MPTSQIENIASNKFSIGAEALLIRDFWKAGTNKLTFTFDFLDESATEQKKEEYDEWTSSKKEIFEKFREQKEPIILGLSQAEAGKIRTGELTKDVNSYYKETLYKTLPGEFKLEKQDDWTRKLLAKALKNYSEYRIINIFLLFKTSEKLEEYITVCNPILSLLRIEYEKCINIEKIFKFVYKPYGRVEGKLLFKNISLNKKTEKDSLITEKKNENNDIQLNKYLNYSLKTGIFTHIQTGHTLDVRTAERKCFMDCIIKKGLEGEKISYPDIAEKLRIHYDKTDMSVNSANKTKIRDIGKNIGKSLIRRFKLNRNEEKFYVTSEGFRFTPYKPE